MKKSKLYTRGGDQGDTSLVSGTRISKGNNRIDLYGEVDELNSVIGLIYCLIQKEAFDYENILAQIQTVQTDLFSLGSHLACESELWGKYKLPQLTAATITILEEQIDKFDSELPELKSFILPGGSVISSHIQIARAVCRRVERKLVLFQNEKNSLPESSLSLLNRLSDYLFALARYVNFKLKIEENIWNP